MSQPENSVEERGRPFPIGGVVLIALGLALFAMQFAKDLSAAVILSLLGVIFIVVYVYRRLYGMLIPGAILMGLGLGSAAKLWFPALADAEAIGLGIGFVAIFAIDAAFRRFDRWWPLIPGLILVGWGLAKSNPEYRYLLSIGWPLILVLIGLLMIGNSYRQRRRQ